MEDLGNSRFSIIVPNKQTKKETDFIFHSARRRAMIRTVGVYFRYKRLFYGYLDGKRFRNIKKTKIYDGGLKQKDSTHYKYRKQTIRN